MHSAKSILNHPACTDTVQGIERARGKLTTLYRYIPLGKTCLAVGLLLFTVQLTAQEVTAEPSSRLERTDFKIGYFGNLTENTGLNLGTEYRWKEKTRVKERKTGQKTIKHQLLLNGSLGYSTNFATRTQNGIFAAAGLTLRRVNAKNRELYVELNPLGMYRSVLSNTYEVIDEEVTSVSFPGRSYYAPSVAIGIGQFRRAKKRSGWYLNLQYTVLTNYNADILPIASLHFGRKFNFSNK